MTEHPIVETSVIRLLKARMLVTHEECGIAAITGPWGIGKTTAITAFADTHEFQCIVVKVEPGGNRGISAIAIMQQVVEALRVMNERPVGRPLNRSYFPMRRLVFEELSETFGFQHADFNDGMGPRFTIIFDEAQNLSREAIEMLRYWNDRDRTTTPFPVGLIFVGNNEFAMAESLGGESVLSGAVRSRLLFEEALSYDHLDDTDLTLFCQSRDIGDAAAISAIIRHFGNSNQRARRPAPKRDLRALERLISVFHRRADGRAITATIVNGILNPS